MHKQINTLISFTKEKKCYTAQEVMDLRSFYAKLLKKRQASLVQRGIRAVLEASTSTTPTSTVNEDSSSALPDL